jgi:hypothetical protein
MPFQVREESFGGFGNGSCTSRAVALSSNVHAAQGEQLLSQRLPALRLIACAVIEMQRSATSLNKQSLVSCANFERGLFKNAAHPPVDGFISRSQN